MHRDKSFEIIKTSILKNDTSNVSVYVNKIMLPANSIIPTMHGNVVSPNFSSWMFFIDDHPFQNWGHPARFVFIGNNGQLVINPHNFPPSYDKMESLIDKTIIVPQKRTMQKLLQIPPQKSPPHKDLHSYAVIISGGYDARNNYERYWNDCSAIYMALIHWYNYDKSHIYVIMADGTNPALDRHLLNGSYDSSPLDLDGDGVTDIQYAATRANITNVFNSLSQTLTGEDNLFIYTTDHGAQHSGQDVYMYLWGEIIEDYEFASEINKVNAHTINITMEQCNSGGFIDNLSQNNRVIMTACTANESSYECGLGTRYTINFFC